ncbi:hypothetical protein [Undibacterium sp.]|uniref:hypothetical protein n=1 Tax=Undibacterium sp. TaxID=1914977 RepID=UPI003750EE0B
MSILLIHNRRLKAIVLLWTMLLVLLSAQWLGFSHRMSHISTVTGEVMTLASDGENYLGVQKLSSSTESSIHSCILFDAASIADGVQHVLISLVPGVFAEIPSVQISILPWFASLSVYFLSRAPPF